VLCASLLLFVAPHLFGWQPSPTGDPSSILWMGAGAAGLTAAAAFLPLAKRPLSSRPCRFLGRVSYSLYLLHYPLILLLAPALVERPLGLGDYVLLLAAVLALGLPLSELSYRCIELPAIRAGNAFGARLARWMHVRFVASRLADRES
jgi:peptidoglycan/LPS O-acetylase OafA/YrhL